MRNLSLIAASLFLSLSSLAHADQTHATMREVSTSGMGKEAGKIKIKDTAKGLELQVELEGLTPGEHGFHVHKNASCEAAAKDGVMTAAWGAGPHFDPAGTGKHEGPAGSGHQGDLPVLIADAAGTVKLTVVAPRLKEADLKGHSLMVHAGPDNYSDQPNPLGGGGARVMCGVIE